MTSNSTTPTRRSRFENGFRADDPRSGARLTSPSPSLRTISNKRVNKSGRPLLSGKPNENPDYSSINEAFAGPGRPKHAEAIDNESFIYKPSQDSPECSSDSSKHNPLEYEIGHDHHVEDLEWRVVLPYYLPILSWVKEYSFSYFLGDLIGGLSLVFFQLPLSLSYATSLAHVPVLCGLLSLGVAPLIYVIFGSVPQMIVGPEAAISLIVGQAVEPLLHHAKKKHIDPIELVVAITFVSAASLLGFGLGRFGFLDNVLSGSLLKGFISGVGIVMIINSTITMLGLDHHMKNISDDPLQMDIHSPFDKILFLFQHWRQLHPLSFKISAVGFVFIMAVSFLKTSAMKGRFKHSQKFIYIPEILITVIIASKLCSAYDWSNQGIEIIGKVRNDENVMQFYNPFSVRSLKLMRKLATSGFLCAMLGFFESTTASKSLGSRYNLPISSNRELVAMGFLNLVGAVLGALPAFGGYGRSKINAMSAKTTMSGGIMGICTFITIYFFLDTLYFIPKCILSVITAKIGISLIDEAPYELLFHWRSRGYSELITFFVTVTTTLFFSMEAGIAVGLVYSLIRVIKHSAMSRIQILGRIPGSNTFVDADINGNVVEGFQHHEMMHHQHHGQLNLFTDEYFTSVNTHVVEEIEGCLIVRIPEPLTFTNTSDLRARLNRVELYGSTKAHPAMKRTRDESMTHYVIFDLRGMTDLDSSAAQILEELLINYETRGIVSFFVRVPRHSGVRDRLRRTGIFKRLYSNLSQLGYFEVQDRVKHWRYEMRVEETLSESSVVAYDLESANEIYDLTENRSNPYFYHISDVLKVIDFYEYHKGVSARSNVLEVDDLPRRSSLPGNEV